MSGSSNALRSLIEGGSPSAFAKDAVTWESCSDADILSAAAKQLGVLQQRAEYTADTGTARQDWKALRGRLQNVYSMQGAILEGF